MSIIEQTPGENKVTPSFCLKNMQICLQQAKWMGAGK